MLARAYPEAGRPSPGEISNQGAIRSKSTPTSTTSANTSDQSAARAKEVRHNANGRTRTKPAGSRGTRPPRQKKDLEENGQSTDIDRQIDIIIHLDEISKYLLF